VLPPSSPPWAETLLKAVRTANAAVSRFFFWFILLLFFYLFTLFFVLTLQSYRVG